MINELQEAYRKGYKDGANDILPFYLESLKPQLTREMAVHLEELKRDNHTLLNALDECFDLFAETKRGDEINNILENYAKARLFGYKLKRT